MGPISSIYALATGILTRSIVKALTALLLVTPRTAMVGAENAEQGAAARVIRAGAITLNTRTSRNYRLPDALFLDGVRLLSDGFEVHHALPLSSNFETADILTLAASVATAAGSPWGGAFRAASSVPAANGSFDGKGASGEIEQVRYTLSPVEIGGPCQKLRACDRTEIMCWCCAMNTNNSRSASSAFMRDSSVE